MKHFCSFSEAIREGALLRPQTRVKLFDENGTCAIGAGLHAMYGDEVLAERLFELDVVIEFPYMLTMIDMCPHRESMRWWQFWKWGICVWGKRSKSLIDAIGHLNDNHEWTREAIADWLEAEEEKLGYVTLIGDAVESTSSVSEYEVAGV